MSLTRLDRLRAWRRRFFGLCENCGAMAGHWVEETGLCGFLCQPCVDEFHEDAWREAESDRRNMR